LPSSPKGPIEGVAWRLSHRVRPHQGGIHKRRFYGGHRQKFRSPCSNRPRRMPAQRLAQRNSETAARSNWFISWRAGYVGLSPLLGLLGPPPSQLPSETAGVLSIGARQLTGPLRHRRTNICHFEYWRRVMFWHRRPYSDSSCSSICTYFRRSPLKR
jgi:hypothetical protein